MVEVRLYVASTAVPGEQGGKSQVALRPSGCSFITEVSERPPSKPAQAS